MRRCEILHSYQAVLPTRKKEGGERALRGKREIKRKKESERERERAD